MDLIKWRPFRELNLMRRDLDRLIDRFFDFDKELFDRDLWAPEIDISESDEEYVVKADIPGIDQKDLSVTLSGGNLTIKGERREEKEEKKKHFHRIERRYGSFQRTIQIPGEVDENKITANYRDGVLEIHLPKTEKTKPREIKVEVK